MALVNRAEQAKRRSTNEGLAASVGQAMLELSFAGAGEHGRIIWQRKLARTQRAGSAAYTAVVPFPILCTVSRAALLRSHACGEAAIGRRRRAVASTGRPWPQCGGPGPPKPDAGAEDCGPPVGRAWFGDSFGLSPALRLDRRIQ